MSKEVSNAHEYHADHDTLRVDNAPLHYKVETKWEDKLRTYMHTFDDHHDRFRHYKWPAAFENQPYFQTPYNDETFSWTVWLQKDALYQRWSTLSQLAVLEGEEAEVSLIRARVTVSGIH